MNLANHIKDLLFRYDCVIVPNFGGFVTQGIGATYNKSTSIFHPPSKQVSFNYHLHKSDGLLIHHVAASEGMTYDEAAKAIASEVQEWEHELQQGEVVLASIGKLHRNETQHIVFEPTNEVNFLLDSFGLATVSSERITRQKELPISQKRSKSSSMLKYAAAAAVAITLGFAGHNVYQNNQQQIKFAKKEKALEKKIQMATFEISNPLPTIELNVTKKIATPYHVVAGSFQFPENAQKKITQLAKKGYDAKIIGHNKWGLTQVAYQSFADRNEALNYLYKIKKTESKDAWLLTK